MFRTIARYLWAGLVATGFATYMSPPPPPAPHPDATEQALWDQLADLFQPL